MSKSFSISYICTSFTHLAWLAVVMFALTVAMQTGGAL